MTTQDLWVSVTADGYLLGATDYFQGMHRIFWPAYYELEYEDWEVCRLLNVPVLLAEELRKQGTHAQVFSDGYEAWAKARQFCL